MNTRGSLTPRSTTSSASTGSRWSAVEQGCTCGQRLPTSTYRSRPKAALEHVGKRSTTAIPPRPTLDLARLDAAAASRVHPNDRRRVVRALELAEHGASLAPERDRLWTADTRLPTIVVGLEISRSTLEGRIRERTEEMLGRGVVDEARRAIAGRISKTAEKALGLRDLVDLPLEQAREQLVGRTLRYAAYQRKWMRRIEGIVMIEADRPPREVADAILEVARAG